MICQQKAKDDVTYQTSPPGMTITYNVIGAGTDADAYAAVYSTCSATKVHPALNCVLSRKDVSLTHKTPCTGGNFWESTVKYELDLSTFSFDCTNESQHIVKSLSTMHAYGKCGNADASTSDFGQMIGWNDEDFDGCDIIVPKMEWSETIKYGITQINMAFAKNIASYVGYVNSTTFRTFPAGEVLYLGATLGNQSNDLGVNVTYKFRVSPNATGLSVGSISNIAKGGHQYLWVSKEQTFINDKAKSFKVPKGVYIEQVYPAGDLAAGLGI